jgi:hypothetical protein
MKRSFGRILSCLFLLLFLYPLAEKELHAFQHSDDFHCASSTAHFHAPEIKCSFCDIYVQEFADEKQDHHDYLPPSPTVVEFPLLSREAISLPSLYISLRAPPFSV